MADEGSEVWRFEAEDEISPVLEGIERKYQEMMQSLSSMSLPAGGGAEAGVGAELSFLDNRLQALRAVMQEIGGATAAVPDAVSAVAGVMPGPPGTSEGPPLPPAGTPPPAEGETPGTPTPPRRPRRTIEEWRQDQQENRIDRNENSAFQQIGQGVGTLNIGQTLHGVGQLVQPQLQAVLGNVFAGMAPELAGVLTTLLGAALLAGGIMLVVKITEALKRYITEGLEEAFKSGIEAMDFHAITGGLMENFTAAMQTGKIFNVDLTKIFERPLMELRAQFASLGVDVGQGNDLVNVLDQVRQKYQAITDAQDPEHLQRYLLLQRAFGEHWKEMVPLMEINNQLWREYVNISAMSAPTKAQETLGREQSQASSAVGEAFRGLGRTLWEPFQAMLVPLLRALAEAVSSSLVFLGPIMHYLGVLLGYIAKIVEALNHATIGNVLGFLGIDYDKISKAAQDGASGGGAGADGGPGGVGAGGRFRLPPGVTPEGVGVAPWGPGANGLQPLRVSLDVRVREKPEWADVMVEGISEALWRKETRG